MSIGTTVRLGFDASAVKKGFSLLPRMFSGAMKGLKWAGVGAAAKVGAGVTDLLGKAIMAVPNGIKDMMDYAGTLNDISNQTKIAVKDLMVLEEAMRLSGAEGDTARMISTFAKNLRSAMTEEGGPNTALRKLGFSPDEFKGLKVDDAFRKIGMAAKDFQGDVGELEDIMSDLFGARMGYKLIRFFSDFEGNMKQASNNVGEWGDQMQERAQGIDDIGDAMGRWKNRWLQLMEVIFSNFNAMGNVDGNFVDRVFDWLNPEKIREILGKIKNTGLFLSEALMRAFKGGLKFEDGEWIQTDGLISKFEELRKNGIFKSLGRDIADGFKEAFRPSGMFKSFIGKDKPATPDRTTSQLIDLNRQQAKSLAKIERSGFPAVLA